MQVSFKMSGSQAVQAAISALPERMLKSVRGGLKGFIRDVREESLENGYTNRSGQLSRSISQEVNESGTYGRAYLDTGNAAPYGPFVHEGTEDRVITPTQRKALRFISGGRMFFSKGHKISGIKPRKFLYRSFDKLKPEFPQRIERAIARVVREFNKGGRG